MTRLLSSFALALVASACATHPEPGADERRHVPPDPGAPAVALDVDIEPMVNGARTVVRVDGAKWVDVAGRRSASTDVKPGSRYVDVEFFYTRPTPLLVPDTGMEPEVRFVPCGPNRECPRTVMVPKNRMREVERTEEVRLCTKSLYVELVPDSRYRLHVTTDGAELCRVVCTERRRDGTEADCRQLAG